MEENKSSEELIAKVQQQIEFWFSDSNIQKDRFLSKKLHEDPDSSLFLSYSTHFFKISFLKVVDISVLASFNKLKALTQDMSLILKAIETSELLELNKEKTRVKRKEALPEGKVNTVDLTVYVVWKIL